MLVLGCTNEKQFQLRKIFSFCELTISSILFSKYISFHLQHIWKGKRMKEIKHSTFQWWPFLNSWVMLHGQTKQTHRSPCLKIEKHTNKPVYIYIYDYSSISSEVNHYISNQAKTQLNQIINYTKAGMFISLNVRSTNSLNNY